MKVNLTTEHRHAFTLIEMILAIGVSALVLVVINAVLFSAIRLRDAATSAVDAVTPIDQTVSFLKRDLQCVVTPTNGTSKVLSGSFRVGDVSSTGISEPVAIEMYTASGALSSTTPWGDIQRVSYELKPATDGSSGQDLVRTVSRNLLTISTPDVTDQLMLHNVSSVKFSCYDGAQWDDNWDTSNPSAVYTNLPTAVRVEIQMGGSSLANAIEVIVPIDAVARTNMVLTSTSGS